MQTRLVRLTAMALLASCCLARSAAAQERGPREEAKTEKTIPVQGIEEVKASVMIGPIKVVADSPNTIQVRAVRHAEGGTADDRRRWLSETKVEIEKQGAALIVKDVVPKSLRQNGHAKNLSMGLDLELHVPSRLAMTLAAGVGDVEATGVAGGLTVATGAGNVRLRQLGGPEEGVTVDVGAGNVTMDGQAGDVRIHSGAGKVSLQNLDCAGKTLFVDTGAGDVSAALRSLPSGNLRINVGTGRIRLSVPDKARADISAASGMGSIRSAFALAGQKQSGGGFGGTLSGNLNGGGAEVSLHTGIGEIQLERQNQ